MQYLRFFSLLVIVFSTAPQLVYSQDMSVGVLENLAKKGDPEAQYKMGTRYISGKGVKKDIKRAIEFFNKSAAQDYTRSLYILGRLYWDGTYIKKNDGKAIEWFERAARKGHGNAQYNLAVILSRYHGSKEFLIKAYAWLSVVAKRGHPKAGTMRDELAKKLEVFDVVQGKRMASSYYQKYVVAFDKRLSEENDSEE